MADENAQSPKQNEVVEVLREGRATPKHIVDHTSLPSKHAAQHHLKELQLAGKVEKVNVGLYELVDCSDGSTYEDEIREVVEQALREVAGGPATPQVDRDEFEFAAQGGDFE